MKQDTKPPTPATTRPPKETEEHFGWTGADILHLEIESPNVKQKGNK